MLRNMNLKKKHCIYNDMSIYIIYDMSLYLSAMVVGGRGDCFWVNRAYNKIMFALVHARHEYYIYGDN